MIHDIDVRRLTSEIENGKGSSANAALRDLPLYESLSVLRQVQHINEADRAINQSIPKVSIIENKNSATQRENVQVTSTANMSSFDKLLKGTTECYIEYDMVTGHRVNSMYRDLHVTKVFPWKKDPG